MDGIQRSCEGDADLVMRDFKRLVTDSLIEFNAINNDLTDIAKEFVEADPNMTLRILRISSRFSEVIEPIIDRLRET